jgi:hypothetical protein
MRFSARKWLGGESPANITTAWGITPWLRHRPYRQTPATPQTQRSLTPDNFDVTGIILKCQIVAHAPELLRYAYVS